MIAVDSLCRSFGETRALDSVSFTVERGEVAGLLGPNGAGKTTCMRIITGFLPPSSGRARVGEAEGGARAARRQIGYLPEGAPIYPEMRVEEYLSFRARLRGLGGRERRRAVARVAERCGVADVRRRIVGQLSRGYRQRVGLADVLLGDPPVLVLDEPTAGLDPNQIREVQALIGELAGAGRTVLLSSHILSQVEAVCSRLLILHRGQLVAAGTPEEITASGADGGETSLVAWVRGPATEVVERLSRLDGLALTDHRLVAGEPETVRCWLRGVASPALRERVAEVVAKRGWGLRELHGDRPLLEEVFAQLTREGTAGEGDRA